MERWKMVVGVAALVVGAAGGAAEAGNWTRVAATGDIPSGRTTPAVGAVGSDVYVFGGLLDDFATFTNDFYDDLYRFDTTTGAWTQLYPSNAGPAARTFAAGAGDTTRGRLYVFGGSMYDPTFTVFQVFGDLWSYSVADNEWTELSGAGAGPGPRSGANLWLDGDTLYVFGGITPFFQVQNDVWAFDLTGGTWTELVPSGAPGSPPPRHVAAASSHGKQGKLTVYGGEALDPFTFQFVMLEDVWQFDLGTSQWTDTTPVPARDLTLHRNYGATTLIGQQLFFYGGDIPGGSSGCGAPFPQNVASDLVAYHLVQHRWRVLAPTGDLPPPLKRTAATDVDGTMYVFSGWDFQCTGGVGAGQVFNTDVYAYDNDG